MILLLLLVVRLAHPQSFNKNLKFARYSIGIGLSSNAQRCIVQDKEGFIWIGTDDGLNRFDGYNFKVYRRIDNDPTSLRSNMINCLFIDTKGTLWVGTHAGGLGKYNREKDNFYNYTTNINDSTALLNNDISTIAEDRLHRLWVGTITGLHLYDPKINGFIRFTPTSGNKPSSKSIAYPHAKKIVSDGEVLWIAYTTGILSALNISDLSFKHYNLFDVSSWHTADFSVNSLVIDGDNIWISTWSKGIWIFNKTNGECHHYEKEESKYINFIFKDDRGNIWYSPEHKGLILLDGNNKINYQYDDYDNYSLSSNSLAAIFQDIQGNLWLASKQGDLNYAILDNPFSAWYKNPNTTHGLTNNLITAVIEDSKGRIWAGYQDGGIDILDSQNKKARIHIEGNETTGLGAGTITYIYESKDGTIWVGKYLDGLKKYEEDRKSFLSYKHIDGDEKSIAGNDIRHITEDSRGSMWIAIHGGGVDKFNPETGKFVHHKHNDNNPSTTIVSDWTFTTVCDKNDNVWVGTVDGVSVLSQENLIIKHYLINTDEGYNLSNSMARTIFIGSKNFVWIGTVDGLNKLDRSNGHIRKYFVKDGLPNSVIMNILEDDHYNLWITTAKGLSKFSPEKETFKNYSVQDGLITDEFNLFVSFKAENGGMYFGGREGLNKFQPDDIKINNFKPPVYITDFRLFNQSVPVKKDSNSESFSLSKQINFCKEINLEYHQNVITLEFVALNYLNLEKNQYRYKLEGFDDKWTQPGYKREVTYTNLHPGEYTFRVIASNSDGIWNTEGARLKIIVNPPFWRTNWAYAFYILTGILLLYLFRKLILHEAEIKRTVELEKHEIQKLQEMDSLKMRFFSNVSHEFRTPLSLIVAPIEKLLKITKDELQQVQLKIVQRNANRLLRLINQLMDFRKIEEDKLELNLTRNDIVSFIKEIIESFEQDARRHNIDLTYKYSHKSYKLWFDDDKLDKIIYNLLSNAFKYTPDNGSITVSLNLDNKIDTPRNRVHSFRHSEINIKKGNEKTYSITISDTGIGIPKEAQSKIFDRFYQVKNPSNIHGTGIGLSLTYELVKLHKGNISVNSDPTVQTGTEFSVTLPLWSEENELPHLISVQRKVVIPSNGNDTPPENAPLETGTPIKNGSTIREKLPHILIIEDNDDMRLFIKNEFKDIYNILEANNGNTGLKKAMEEIPDTILCDIMMPGMNGYEICKTLKQDERTSHIPVIMLTAKSSEQHTIEGFECGADDYVTKPFSSAILSVRIKNLIESRILLRKKFVKEPFASITEISPSKTDEKLINKAYSIVAKNMHNPNFEVNDFTFEIGMSRTQLYRKIQAISGQSVREFIRIIRLKKAAELLVTEEKNISEIAYAVGFNSLSYFTTSFTDYFKMTPTKYKEKYISLS